MITRRGFLKMLGIGAGALVVPLNDGTGSGITTVSNIVQTEFENCSVAHAGRGYGFISDVDERKRAGLVRYPGSDPIIHFEDTDAITITLKDANRMLHDQVTRGRAKEPDWSDSPTLHDLVSDIRQMEVLF